MKLTGWVISLILLAVFTSQPAQAGLNIVKRKAPSTPTGFYALYEQNRQLGHPNLITLDFVLLNYALIQQATQQQVEKEVLLQLLEQLINNLEDAVAADKTTPEAIRKPNQQWLQLLNALLKGDTPDKESAVYQEWQLITQAKQLTNSPLFSYPLDYTQFKPRGYYTQDQTSSRYFQAMRYASAVLFPVQHSQATEVTAATADQLTRQAMQLAKLIDKEASLQQVYQSLLSAMEWQYGANRDLTVDHLLAGFATVEDPSSMQWSGLRRTLLTNARAQERQPRVLGGVVQLDKLEEGLSPQDVLTGFRLLPQLEHPVTMAFQSLVFDSVGEYQGNADCQQPDTAAMIGGRVLKAFPTIDEIPALLGVSSSLAMLDKECHNQFKDYDAAAQEATKDLGSAVGAPLYQMGILQASGNNGDWLNAAKGLLVWQKYLGVLYEKQSYTPGLKSLQLSSPRPGARIEPSGAVLSRLWNLVEQHRQMTPNHRWQQFSSILAELIAIEYRQQLGVVTDSDEEFLNRLDSRLKTLVTASDQPIVIDVHTVAAVKEVLTWATGYPKIVTEDSAAGNKLLRGARFSLYEFRQPMSDRLTNAQWRQKLEGQLKANDVTR